jgi:Family of unknown function (DUF5647)
MIDPHQFAQKQFELTAEFGKYVFAHPEADDLLPEGAFVYFEIEGEPEYSEYSRELAGKQRREEGVPVVLVRVKGLAPPQVSRLIDPVIEPAPTTA